jgi:uncharacterized protein YjlB
MTSSTLQVINWEAIELETVNQGMQRRIVTGAKMTVARIYFDDGFIVPMHSHHNEQITQVLKGQMRFAFGGDEPKELVLGAGDVVVIPTCIGEVEEIDMWAPRRDDWLDGTDEYLRN